MTDYADWAPVVIDKRRGGGGGGAAARAAAARTGTLVVEKRFDAGHNPLGRAAGGAGAGAARLAEDTEHFAHAHVGHDLSLAIQQARLAKKMTQKELAAAICEKSTVVSEYEAGKAIPNGAIIAKLERALGAHLPRPPKKK